MSRSPRSVWVEIIACPNSVIRFFVTLPTERVSWNVKKIIEAVAKIVSRSPRSVWVEMIFDSSGVGSIPSRSPRSVWVEILLFFLFHYSFGRHAPHGACELKLIIDIATFKCLWSRSPRSVWVEMANSSFFCVAVMSRSPRSVWVEIVNIYCATI